MNHDRRTRPDVGWVSPNAQGGTPLNVPNISSLFVLRCVTCKELLPSMLATTAEEMLDPQSNVAVKLFHSNHIGHSLDAVPFDKRFEGFPTPADEAAAFAQRSPRIVLDNLDGKQKFIVRAIVAFMMAQQQSGAPRCDKCYGPQPNACPNGTAISHVLTMPFDVFLEQIMAQPDYVPTESMMALFTKVFDDPNTREFF